MRTNSLRMFGRHALATIAAMAFAAGVPAAASAEEPEGFPPETLAPSQEAADFFAVLEELAQRGESLPDVSSEVGRALEPVLAELFTRGERDPNWTTRGVDIHRVVATFSGGVEANMLSMPEQFGPLRILLVDVPLDHVAPTDWTLVGRFGAVEGGDVIHTEYGQISPKLMLAERVAYRRHGNALCRESAETRIYSNPRVTASEADTVAYFVIQYSLPFLEQNRVCAVHVEVQQGVYQDQAFDDQGYRLPELDEDGPFTVVPRSADAGQAFPG